MGPLRLVYSHTIWGHLSDQFHCLLYGALPPQISFFACYRGGGGHLRIEFFHKIYGGPFRSVSPLTIWGPLRLVTLLTIWDPLRSVSVHTFWRPLALRSFFFLLYGPPQISFFEYYMGALQISFFAYYMGVL